MNEEITQLHEAAVTAHELFVSLMAAGFTEAQALQLTANVILGNQSGETP